jgi:outer membrane protein TolC
MIYKLAFLLLLMQFGTARAGEMQSLTVDECVAIGIENSYSLHSSRMELQRARAKSSEAGSYRLPSLSATANYAKLSEVPPFTVTLPSNPTFSGSFIISPTITNTYSVKLNLMQPVFTGFRLSGGHQAAKDIAEASMFDFKGDSTDLSFKIRVAYWSLYKAMEYQKAVADNVKLVEAHLADAQNFLDQGLLTRNDLLKVKTHLSQSRLMLLDADNAVRLAGIQLNTLIGLPLSTKIVIKSEPVMEDHAESNLDSLVQMGLASRMEIHAVERRVSAARHGVTVARSGYYPQIYLGGEYDYAKPNQRYFPAKDEWNDSWSIGVGISLDIWNWGRTHHQTSQAKAQLNQAQDAMAQLRDAVQLEITADYLGLQKAIEAVDVARDGVSQADENYRMTKDKFEAGIASNTDLLDAEVALLQARTSYTAAVVDRRLAKAKLQASVGK